MNKTVEDPKVAELEQQIPMPDISAPQQEEPILDVPPEIPGSSIDQTKSNPLNTESSSPIRTAETHDDDVVITNTSFRESGRPTVLVKHSAKEQYIE